jgi:hypothetical protein
MALHNRDLFFGGFLDDLERTFAADSPFFHECGG